ncbi:hypothetical protein E4U13_004058 [Claviceps humidiphila]|uniref:Major facilitator superfamily (MFS) profile domain-containing protein n=1 Tax=Claviceps humidiphila TaxID=1294629 RepID=A0A9P7TW36_9HYPO|nr:hypothetical protein E4U13_004058 [Claviceps humidiphila]
MLEDRLHVDKSQTQAATSLVLSFHACASMVTSPLIGYLADKTASRKMSLIASLVAEMIGTIIIMVSQSGAQAVALACAPCRKRIPCHRRKCSMDRRLATLSETVGQEKTGKTLGAISSIYTSGLLFGPMASGILLPLVGYWATWCVPIAILAMDLIMRLVMIENKQGLGQQSQKNGPQDLEETDTGDATDVNEQTALLGDALCDNRDEPRSDARQSEPCPETMTSIENFYTFVFTNGRALTAVACHSTMAVILLSLDTTLPLHAYRTFGWGTAEVSLMFLFLQLPSLLLATLMGMVKDRSGTRLPTGMGLLVMAVFLWLLGAAGEDGPRFLSTHGKSQIMTIMSLIGIGTARTLVSGSAILEITNVVKDAQSEKPHRFGPNGKLSSGYSITNFFWNTGMLIGPILSGELTRKVGYYYMNTVIGALCCIVGVLVLSFFGRK